MIIKTKFLLMLILMVCLASMRAYSDQDNNGNENQEWNLPSSEESTDLINCEADETCYLYVNVICPLSISCSGDQEITMCSDQDLTESDLEGFDFDFRIGGSPGASFHYLVTVNEYSETQEALVGNQTALHVTGFDVQVDMDGTWGPGRFFPKNDGCNASDRSGFYVFGKTENLMEGSGVEVNGCVGEEFQPIIRVDINGIQADGNVYIGMHRIAIQIHAEYVM